MLLKKSNNSKAPRSTVKFSFGFGVIKLLTGRISAQALVFITAPVLTRLYSPEDFGVYQLYLSMAGIIAVVTCLRYELSIPLAKNDEEATASFTLCLFFTLIFTLLTLVLVWVLREDIAQCFKASKLNVFLWLLPIAVFIGGLESALRYWAAREGKFGSVAWSNFSNSVGWQLVPIAWVFIIGSSVAGLFAGYFAGAIFGLLLLLLLLGQRLLSSTRKANLSVDWLFGVAKKYKKFPIYSTWSGVLNTISRELPPMIFGLFFSTAIVGYYALGLRLISLPINLLGNSISQVFFPSAAKEYAETGTLSHIVSSLFTRLVQIGIFPMMAIGFLGPTFFKFVFGQEWIEAGTYAQIMAIGCFFAFVSGPLNSVFAILNRQEIELRLNILFFLGRTACLLIGGFFCSPKETLILFVAVSVVLVLISIYCKLRLSNVSTVWASKTILKYMVISGLLLLPIRLMLWLLEDPIVLLAELFFIAVCYIIVLLKTDPSFRTFGIELLTNFTARKDRTNGI